MGQEILEALHNKMPVNKEDAYSLLSNNIKSYCERVAHNTQILFSKAVQKGIYSNYQYLKDECIRLVYDAVRFFDIGYSCEEGESVFSGTALPIQHVLVGPQIVFSDVKRLEDFKTLDKNEKIIRQMAKDAASYHHERWDGEGYPDGLKMEETPVIARMCSLCFAFDKLTSNWGKETPVSKGSALEIIKQYSGTAFDPLLTEALLECASELAIEGEEFKSYEEIQAELKKEDDVKRSKKSAELDYKDSKKQLRPIEMWYQPIVNTQTNKIVHYEALMRLNDRYYGVVNPALFIPVAEKTGQICEMTEIALEQVLEMMIISENANLEFQRVSINISAKHICRKTFIQKTKKIIEHSGISPDKLIFEITESMVATADQNLLTTIAQLRELGIKIALDDFGMEYSTLSRLNKLNFDILKIDKSFIDTIVDNSRTRGIVKGIIDMAKSLNLEIISEGVENKQQQKILQDLGCYTIQGFLYGKPKPLSQLIG